MSVVIAALMWSPVPQGSRLSRAEGRLTEGVALQVKFAAVCDKGQPGRSVSCVLSRIVLQGTFWGRLSILVDMCC